MFCENCGMKLSDGQKFCAQCGTPVKARPAQPTYQQPTYQQPVYQQPVYQQPTYQQPVYQNQQMQPDMPMKWFKFLIYFALIAGAIINIGQGIMMLAGAQYGAYTEEVYDMCEELKTIDMVMGLALIGVAVLQIMARFRLAGYCQNGPTLLKAVYLTIAAVNLFYAVAVSSTLPEEAVKYLDFTSTYTSVAVNIAMVAINTTYFNKRKHLFTK